MAKIDETELLSLLDGESKAALGFDNDSRLTSERTTALEYFKGEMKDAATAPGRSRAVSTDVADLTNTVMPDLIDIFTGGEDVAVFAPVGEEDEEAARQETDYVNHVFFHENDGFRVLATMFQDALLSKIGVATWWYEETSEEIVTPFEGLTMLEIEAAKEEDGAEVRDLEALSEEEAALYEPNPDEIDPQLAAMAMADPSIDTTLYKGLFVRTEKGGCVKVAAVPPEDVAFAVDATSLRDAAYASYKARPRAQDLLAMGYDKRKVESLPAYGAPLTDEANARRANGEDEQAVASTNPGLRRVEIVAHFLKADLDGSGKPEYWRVVTDRQCSVVLDKRRVASIQMAVITPYLVTHSIIGRSLADLAVEIQRIKTALLRMMLDDGYFAQNQRTEVAMDRINQFTLADLVRNEPGRPIRSKSGDAVRPITAGGLNFDVAGAIELVSTMSEQRTGIVRNAQGLNPDTLHKTAAGAQQLIAAAQKRVRMIARMFAETGVKDLFLGIHDMLREHASKEATVRLRGKWVKIAPTSWGRRKDMVIEVGVGAGGREHDLAVLGNLVGLQKEIVAAQGGLDGPLVDAKNVYALLKRVTERSGVKTPELFFTDPDTKPPAPPPVDPKVEEAKAKLELEREKAAGELQLARERMQAEMRLARERMMIELRLKMVDPSVTGLAENDGLSPVRLGGDMG